MSLESKIKELMEAKRAKQLNEAAAGKSNDGEGMNANKQGDSQAPAYTEVDPFTGSPKGQDASLKKGPQEPKVKQGDSQDASYTETDPHNAASNTPDTSLSKGNSEPQAKQGNSRDAQYSAASGKGHNGTYETPVAPGNGVKAFEDTEIDGDAITEGDLDDAAPVARKIEMNLESLRKDIASVFAGDENLSEEFKTQAGSIFEAAVIARVNNEVEAIAEELAAQNAADFEELKEGLVEKVDSYLNYVVEQWMQENEVAVEQGLRTEVAEDFMVGLKNLFQEHYFEVPEDRIDVLEDLDTKVEEVTARLDESIAVNVELKTELDAIKRDRIIEQSCRDLTATDAEKMAKLLEGVEFDNEKLFEEKVKVVKENYFPGTKSTSPEKMLEESVQFGSDQPAVVPAHMKSYVEALSRGVKAKKNLG
jgi:hypothetical protein